MKKIRNKLLLVLLVISLLPALFIGASALWTTSTNLKSNAIKTHVAKVSLLSERIERYVSSANSDLLYLSESSPIKLYLASIDSDASHSRRLLLTNLRNSLIRFSDQKAIFSEITITDNRGKEIAKIVRNENGSKALSDTLLRSIEKHESYSETTKLKKGDIYLSRYKLKRSSEDPNKPDSSNIAELNYSTPLFDQNNNKQGTLILSLDTKKIDELIQDQISGEKTGKNTEQLYFIDKNGGFYFHQDEKKRWGQDENLATKFSLYNDYPDLKNNIDKARNSFYAQLQGAIAAYSPVYSDNNEQIGTIISIIPDSLLSKSVNNFIMVFLGVILITLLSTFMIALMLSNSFTKPILELTDNVNQLSKGELDTPIQSDSDDEIGDLSRSIERLRKSMNILMRRASSE